MNLSVIWKLQDLMTPVMNRVTRTSQTAQAAVDRANAVMNRGFVATGNSVNSLRDKIDNLKKYRDGLIIGVDTKHITAANRELSVLERNLDRIERKSNQGAAVKGGMFSGLKGMAAGLGLYAAIGAGQGILNEGMQMGKNEASFTYFTQNVDKAQKIIDQLKAYSNKYAMYQRSDLMESAARIADTMGADSVMRITEMVGKLAQGNSENFRGIITRLQQIRGTGYLQGDELMELLNRGVFGLDEEIARFKGITMQRFYKLKEQQGISYQDVEDALMRMTNAGGKYEKILDVIASTTFGKWETIRSTIRNKVIDIAFDTSSSLNGALDFVIRFFNNSAPIGKAFDKIAAAVKSAFLGILRVGQALGIISTKGDAAIQYVELISKITNGLAWIMNWAAKGINAVATLFEKYPWTKYAVGFLAINYAVKSIDWADHASNVVRFASKFNFFPAIKAGFEVISKAMALLWANPIGLVVLGVMALGAAIYFAWQKSETFRAVTIQVWEGLKAVWSSAVERFMSMWKYISAVMLIIRTMWFKVTNYIVESATNAWNYVANKFSWVADVIGGITDWISKKFSLLWPELVSAAKSTALGIANAFTAGLAGKVLTKFGIGFEEGKQVAAAYEVARKAAEKTEKTGPIAKFLQGNMSNVFGPGMKAGKFEMPAVEGAGKASGITDTVNGNVSKQVTINLNSKIADINNYFQGSDNAQSIAKQIGDQVLVELNRILMTGDRLAIE